MSDRKRLDLAPLRVVQILMLVSVLIVRHANASDNDYGFLDCNAKLTQDGSLALGVHWQSGPLKHDISVAVQAHIPDSATVKRWLSHTNPNGTDTIVVEASNPTEDMDYWILMLKSDGTMAVKEEVSAIGAGISRTSMGGINGVYFCTKVGHPREWRWNGSTWQ